MEGSMGASGCVTKQIAADLRPAESGRQMSGVNDGGGGGEQREKDSDKCGSVVLIVQRCPAISPQAVPSLGDLWPIWRLLGHRMCAAPHVCLRERGRLDGDAHIIAHRGHEEN